MLYLPGISRRWAPVEFLLDTGVATSCVHPQDALTRLAIDARSARMDRPGPSPGPQRSTSMNGPHDMGGMHGFGRVEPEENEPVFHADWEKTVLTSSGAIRSRGLVNIDEFRHAIERMPPAE